MPRGQPVAGAEVAVSKGPLEAVWGEGMIPLGCEGRLWAASQGLRRPFKGGPKVEVLWRE